MSWDDTKTTNDLIKSGDWNDKVTDLNGRMSKSGNESISGVKTFSSFFVTPSSTPTSDYQVVNKKYIDDNAGISYSVVDEDITMTSNSGYIVN